MLTSSPKNIRLAPLSRVILMAGLGFTFLFTPELPPTPVKALEVKTNQAAASNSWKGASFPVENFQAYTSPYGYRGQEFHRGLDIAAPEGSYIRNWWAGRVVEVSDEGNCGTSIIIQSGPWQHVYCHMQGRTEAANGNRYLIDRAGGIQIWEGQMIPAGARIGRVGMTGRTTGPHLHWGLKYSEQWVDPAMVLRAMYGQQISVSSRPQE